MPLRAGPFLLAALAAAFGDGCGCGPCEYLGTWRFAEEAWTEQAPPRSPRLSHTATALEDGRVLVVGGVYGGIEHRSTELYDPTRDAWEWGPPLERARWAHTATRLRDGTVLVTGGWQHAGEAVAFAERWDPATEAWRPVASMASRRAEHEAVLLADGRVLVVGGSDGERPLATAEVFDPTSERWEDAGTLETPRLGHRAVVLRDARVLVAGGWNGDAAVASVEIWDPLSPGWRQGPRLAEARAGHSATLLADGRVLLAGGGADDPRWPSEPSALTSAELFDPVTSAWTPAASMQSPRAAHEATVLDDGQVLVTGGEDSGSPMPDGFPFGELYDPATNQWKPTTAPAIRTFGHRAVLLPDGTLLLLGGDDGILASCAAA